MCITPKAQIREATVNKRDCIKLKSFWTTKDNHQNEKATKGMEENIHKLCFREGIDIKVELIQLNRKKYD